jgi:hypothetical protein
VSHSDEKLGQIERAQAGLRRCIEQSKRLARESDELVKRCRGGTSGATA